MAVARGLVEELVVRERQQRHIAFFTQHDGHLRDALRCRVPCPAEHQPLIGRHFEIFAADLVIVAIVGLEADAEMAADPDVHIGLDRID